MFQLKRKPLKSRFPAKNLYNIDLWRINVKKLPHHFMSSSIDCSHLHHRRRCRRRHLRRCVASSVFGHETGINPPRNPPPPHSCILSGPHSKPDLELVNRFWTMNGRMWRAPAPAGTSVPLCRRRRPVYLCRFILNFSIANRIFQHQHSPNVSFQSDRGRYMKLFCSNVDEQIRRIVLFRILSQLLTCLMIHSLRQLALNLES